MIILKMLWCDNDYNKTKFYKKKLFESFKIGIDENGFGCNFQIGKDDVTINYGVERNNKYSIDNLGVQYLNGEYVIKNINKAKELFQKSADKGVEKSTAILGYIYEFEIEPPNIKLAFELYKKAANGGNDLGQNLLADCYYEGKGTEKDLKLAKKWYEKSAKQNNKRSLNKLQTFNFII